jgi:hypothetical protein
MLSLPLGFCLFKLNNKVVGLFGWFNEIIGEEFGGGDMLSFLMLKELGKYDVIVLLFRVVVSLVVDKMGEANV